MNAHTQNEEAQKHSDLRDCLLKNGKLMTPSSTDEICAMVLRGRRLAMKS
jgi:hypothetical protein